MSRVMGVQPYRSGPAYSTTSRRPVARELRSEVPSGVLPGHSEQSGLFRASSSARPAVIIESMRAQPQPLLSARDLEQIPDDGFRYELLAGEIRRMPPAGHRHGRVAARFTWRLAQYVETHRLGAVFAAETGFLLSHAPDTVRAPDVSFVRQDRLTVEISDEGFWPGAPDLAVEVVSPSDSFSAVAGKALDWLTAGARAVVLVDPQRSTAALYRSRAEIRILGPDDALEVPDVVPGWSLRVGELFEEPA
jgi:Uma2 family endonuclease